MENFDNIMMFDDKFKSDKKILDQANKILETIVNILKEKNGSDIFFQTGAPPAVRNKSGDVEAIEGVAENLDNDVMRALLELMLSDEIYNRKLAQLSQGDETDFVTTVYGLRFRVNAARITGFGYGTETSGFAEQMKGMDLGIYMRYIPEDIPSLETIGLPSYIKDYLNRENGLILVTGPTGSGKSTTLATMVDYINKRFNKHIITIEDPIEYVIPSKESYVTQRQVGTDTRSFVSALRSALRQDPDVIVVGEMRDAETIVTALQAASTGHLVFSTLHTTSAKQTVERILTTFKNSGGEDTKYNEIKMAFASNFSMIIAQKLIPKINGGKYLAYEIMLKNSATYNAIMNDKFNQIENIIYQSREEGMVLMNQTLYEGVVNGIISEERALATSTNHKELFEMFKEGGYG